MTTLNAQLSELTDEQAGYIGVPKQGRFKSEPYRSEIPIFDESLGKFSEMGGGIRLFLPHFLFLGRL